MRRARPESDPQAVTDRVQKHAHSIVYFHTDPSAVGGLAIAGGVGSLINHSFSSIIIGIYEVM